MRAAELILKLLSLNVELDIQDDNLVVDAIPGTLTDYLITQIKENKNEIINILKLSSRNDKFYKIKNVEKKDYYSLSSVQKRLYSLQQMDQDSVAYNMPFIIYLGENVDKKKVIEIVKQIVARHDSFRTSFEIIEEEPIQYIHKKIDFKIEEYCITEDEERQFKDTFIRIFDLSQIPLFRIAILEIIGKGFLLLIDMHHIISDGVSFSILEQEFRLLYEGINLVPLRLQYKDFSEWQNDKENQEKLKNQEEYWISKFKGEIPVLNIPTDYIRKTIKSNKGATVDILLSKDETQVLKSLVTQDGFTLYMSILSIFKLLLSKISSQNDIIVGTSVAGRNHVDVENIVGMFVNTLVLRNEVNERYTLQEFFDNLKVTIIEAFDNQEYQFEDFVEKICIERDVSRNPVFDVMFNLQNQVEKTYDFLNLSSCEYEHIQGIAKFDFTLTATDFGKQILLSFEYCTDLFKAKTIERYIKFFRHILTQISTNLDKKIAEIKLIDEVEKEKLLFEFNNTRKDYAKNKTIHELFEEQVEKEPNRILVVNNDIQLTYGELNARSNTLAHVLRTKGVENDTIVGIMIEKSLDIIIGIIGILKAGGAYLPIDTEYPEDRKVFMIEDSGTNIILTNSNSFINIKGECELVLINSEIDYSDNKNNLSIINKPNDLAYVIYTSGTSGMPKGTLLEHRGIVSENEFWKDTFQVTANEHILFFSSPSFDASVSEIFMTLLNGAKIIIPQKEIKSSINLFEEIVKKYLVSIITLPPIFASNISDNIIENLKVLVTAGSETNEKLIEKCNNKVTYLNAYGPTETSICVTAWDTREFNSTGIISIGQPIYNTRIYILNKNLNLQGIGMLGEICISGVGIGRGYLGNPELTKEKFAVNPFEDGVLMYKTGDAGKWLPDGNIEFVGRLDRQIKLRGYRIELAEIETILLSHIEIDDCIVIVKEKNGSQALTAYVVCSTEFNEVDIRAFLLTKLPDYMIPSFFILLDALPMDNNGKVNLKALQYPNVNIKENYVEPRNEKERILADIWSSVLSAEKVGINDNFFSLGGDSIKSIQIQAKLNKNGYQLDVKDVFLNPTISSLADKMMLRNQLIPQNMVEGELKLTPIQKDFFTNPEYLHHFNQSVLLHSEVKLDELILKKVFNKIQEHHDIFRIVFFNKNNKPALYNRNIDNFPLDLQTYNLENETDVQIKLVEHGNEIQKSINLEEGPLMKLGLFRLKDGDRLLIVIHHLIIDGISWRILFEDIETLYQQALHKEKLVLPLKTNSFKEWSSKIGEYANSKKLLEEISFWENIGNQKIERLKREVNLKDTKLSEEDTLENTLNEYDTSQLLRETHKVYSTEINDILLCALGYSIKKTLGNEKILISMEGHGREDIIPNFDISRTIGWFTTLYPTILDMKYSDDMSLQIQHIKECLHQIPNKGIGYGILKYITNKDLIPNLKFNDEPSIEFNYLGQFDSDVEQMSQFKVLSDYVGENINEKRAKKFDFSFAGMIVSGKLTVNVKYKRKYYTKKLVSELLDNYKASILEIIDHCKSLDISSYDRVIDSVLVDTDIDYAADEMII